MRKLVATIILIFLYWLFFIRPRRVDFWKTAGRHPDEAYDFFTSRQCWKVFVGSLPVDYHNIVPKEEWAGPYRLTIPRLGNRIIYVFGKIPEFEQSQLEFLFKKH
jgi:hypothetical protein